MNNLGAKNLRSAVSCIFQDLDNVPGGLKITGVSYGQSSGLRIAGESLLSDDSERLHAKQLATSQIILEILPRLVEVLNTVHKTDYTPQEWRLMLGHWLYRFVSALVQRIYSFEAATQIAKPDILIVRDRPAFRPPRTSSEATEVFNSPSWNEAIYRRIAVFTDPNKARLELKLADLEIVPGPKLGIGWLGAIKHALVFAADIFTRLVHANSKYFVYTSYLPVSVEIKLHILLGQPPQFWRPNRSIELNNPDSALRDAASKSLLNQARADVSRHCELVMELIFENIPTTFLENFSQLKAAYADLGWPEAPASIFTSNRFDGDDVFKRYVVDKSRSGSKYLVGQHGNNYGTRRYPLQTIEEETADKFFTWGWEKESQKYVPGFVIKLAEKTLKSNKKGGLLLVETIRDHDFELYDVNLKQERYFHEQINFVRGLNTRILDRLQIRLHIGHEALGWGEKGRWSQAGFDSRYFSDFREPIFKAVQKARCVVHSYDSTGMLETLSQNIPTLAFWQEGLYHLNDETRKDYELLVEAGIVHFDSKSLSSKLNTVWDDLDGWWHSDEVQRARVIFTGKHARIARAPAGLLARFIRGEI